MVGMKIPGTSEHFILHIIYSTGFVSLTALPKSSVGGVCADLQNGRRTAFLYLDIYTICINILGPKSDIFSVIEDL